MIDNFYTKYRKYIYGLCGVNCRLLDIGRHVFMNFTEQRAEAVPHTTENISSSCGKCGKCQDTACSGCGENCNMIHTHLYGTSEARRWGGKYIYYCPRGLIFIAVAPAHRISETTDLGSTFSVICGPIVMGTDDDNPLITGIPSMETVQVNALAEILSFIFTDEDPIQNPPEGMGYVFEFGDIKHTDTIYKVTAYIKENYMHKITLDEIAGHVYLSKSYLSRIFKDEIKCGLTSYVNALRVEKIKLLLSNPTLTLCDIANMTGFDDQSYFTKIFKKFTGVSPGKYREKNIRNA